jgi:F-type H+-transporting ATPase subunit epsilon
MLPDALTLEVVTPERAVVRESVAEVQLPGRAGYLGVLPGHTPLLTELATGALSYRQGAQTHRVAVAGGFAEVLPDRVIVLADAAERAEEIDAARARAALAAAEKQLADAMGAAGTEWEAAQQAITRARTRLAVAAPDGTAAHGSEGHSAP